MDNFSPPRNQQARQDATLEGTNSAINTEPDISFQSFGPSESFPERSNHETDLHSSSPQRISPVQAIERENTCRNCCNNGLSINQHSTPLRNNLTLGSVYSGTFQQREHNGLSINQGSMPSGHDLTFGGLYNVAAQQKEHSVNDGTHGCVDLSRIQKSTECFRDESPGSTEVQYDRTQIKGDKTTPVKPKKEKKEKKTISSKTFAHGLMDMSLMTSNASQLRSIMSNPNHEFYNLLMYLLIASVVLQILSGIVLIVADFHKSQIKEKDRQNQKKRKTMNFVALAMMMLITSLNVLITAFNTPSNVVYRTVQASPPQQPVFSPASYQLNANHTEL